MSPELSDQQILELKKKLRKRLEDLREEIREELLQYDNEQYLELAGRVHDNQDESVADLLVDLNLAVIDRHIRETRSIEAALLSMARGIYGLCTDCDAVIDYRRLLACPTARRCRRCQEIYEKNHIQEKHASL
jgi:DnaK suppressor protein